jgi:hypothetical protein
MVVSPWSIRRRYSAGVDSAPDLKILDVHVSRIRRKLAKFDITIDTQYGSGWSMTAENRAKLQGLTISSIEALAS